LANDSSKSSTLALFPITSPTQLGTAAGTGFGAPQIRSTTGRQHQSEKPSKHRTRAPDRKGVAISTGMMTSVTRGSFFCRFTELYFAENPAATARSYGSPVPG
jgi:hypothetical protein